MDPARRQQKLDNILNFMWPDKEDVIGGFKYGLVFIAIALAIGAFFLI